MVAAEGGRAERRQVGGHHREQRLNGVAAGDGTGEAELGQQDDDLEDQDHDHDAAAGVRITEAASPV